MNQVLHLLGVFVILISMSSAGTWATHDLQKVGSAKQDQAAVVMLAAGDIADCTNLAGAEATAKILDENEGVVAALGDLAYPDGTEENFKCYDQTWGRVKSRTRPSPGNHEFHSQGATFYFKYFGKVAGDPEDGFYSYDLGAWHIISLNSECAEIGGCNEGSREEKWLRADLAAHPATCTLAYFHKPLFSSGGAHGDAPEIRPLYQALYDANADVILSGHDHDYERFAPQDPSGKLDRARGIREFVVGTGGKNHRPFGAPEATSEIRDTTTFGVLKLTLRPTGYDWKFIPEAGKSFTDSGSDNCH
jgi:acid phosphatase type 7